MRWSGLDNVFLPPEFLVFLGLKEGPDYRDWVQETEERVATFARSPGGSLLAGMLGRGGGRGRRKGRRSWRGALGDRTHLHG